MVQAFDEFNAEQPTDGLEIRIKSLYKPQTDVVCYAISVPGITTTPDHLNLLTNRLYQEMSVSRDKSVYEHQYLVSKTSLAVEDGLHDGYEAQITPFLQELNILGRSEKPDSSYNLQIIRSTLMNPLLGEHTAKGKIEFFEQFTNHLQKLVYKILPEVLLEILKEDNDGERLKVLWIENKSELKTIKQSIESGIEDYNVNISSCIDIQFENEWKKKYLKSPDNESNWQPDAYIIDLNLADPGHKEMISGLKAIRDIKRNQDQTKGESEASPPIIVYSQFLSDNYTSHNGYSPAQLKKYLNYYANIEEDFMLGKTLKYGKAEFIPETEDINEIIIALIRMIRLSNS
jgi:hypothetical protein